VEPGVGRGPNRQWIPASPPKHPIFQYCAVTTIDVVAISSSLEVWKSGQNAVSAVNHGIGDNIGDRSIFYATENRSTTVLFLTSNPMDPLDPNIDTSSHGQ